MQLLERVHLVQFFLFEAQTLELDATSAIIAPNGAGKSALLDALQIVLLGGDRSRIRFNAQAGGSHRARTIRDYCLGVFRSGDAGRKRKTATTYVSLVFRDTGTGEVLTAGIALGASVDEPDHRTHGLYLLPGVALDLADHVEQVNGKELPLAWPTFREMVVRRCKDAGGKPELHTVAERFVKDLLLRLRAAPGANPDINAYRKAFLTALNLQRVEDVDLFVRTLVAEDRPTDIARFRALLESFRQIRDRIAQVRLRIEAAEGVEHQYDRIAAQAVRAASYRALSAEYARDLYSEQLEQAEDGVATAQTQLATLQRTLVDARSARDLANEAHAHAQTRLQSSQGYGEQAQFDAIAERERTRQHQLRQLLLQELGRVRDQIAGISALAMGSMIDGHALDAAHAFWAGLHATVSAQSADGALPMQPERLFDDVRQGVHALQPLLAAVEAHARAQRVAFESANDRLATATQNQKRLAAGQAELGADTVRLMHYLQEEGIEARPVCDLVRVSDPDWQFAIEGYLRGNVEALLIPEQHEQRAVKLLRALGGGRAVYGVKLAMSSHARNHRGASPTPDSVAALLDGDNAEALAFLRRQLGELRRVDSEPELLRSRQGLTRDGVLARGGSIERLRLPAAGDLRIGASDNRTRLRVLHQEIETAAQAVRAIEPALHKAETCVRGLARLSDADAFAGALHTHALEHREVTQRHRSASEHTAALQNPDLLQLAGLARALKTQVDDAGERVENLIGDEAVARRELADRERLRAGLQQQEAIIARRAVDAFRNPDVDPNLVERHRDDLDEKVPTLEERGKVCERRAEESDRQLSKLVPEAWSALAQYARDHGLGVEFDASAWRPALILLQRELSQLRDTDLVRYEGDARQAYDTAVETFRASVAAALNDNFARLRQQIGTLNRTLRSSPPFSNNERYRFHYEVVPEFKDLERFIRRATEAGGEDGLFGTAGEVPEAFRDLIEGDTAARVARSPLDDYRRFFRFEVEIRQDDRTVGTLSERMRSGSGGEHRAPLYVIAGAALAAAYGKSEAHPGGLGLILLDEFGDKIDAQNARATANYLRSLGLQLVLAAPDTAQGTLSGVLDSYIELFRDGELLQAERIEVQAAARDLLLSDQFDLHPALLTEETARIERQLAAE